MSYVADFSSVSTTGSFARQKSKLAGAIRGSFFVIKGES